MGGRSVRSASTVIRDSKEGDIRVKKARVPGRFGFRKGQTLTEYSLIVMFVGIAAYSAYEGLGVAIKDFSTMVLNFITAVAASL